MKPMSLLESRTCWQWFQWGWGWCATLLKQTTCLVVGFGLRNSLSLVSLPQLELSLISVENFLDALGLGGAALLLWFPKFKPIFLEHTCDCICSQTLLNLRILPEINWKFNLIFLLFSFSIISFFYYLIFLY